MKYSIQFLKMKCSQTTRQVTRSDMKDSSINPRKFQCRRCLGSVHCSSGLLLKKGEGRTAARASEPRERALDLRNAGGARASPSPTHPPDPCAMTPDLSRHRASATAGPGPRDHTAGRSTISPFFFPLG